MNYDIIILGAGPAGLWTATQCGILGLQTLIIEKLSSVGGQCSNLYPEKKIYDIPGSYNITGQRLSDNLAQQVEQQGIKILLNCCNYRLESDLTSNKFNIHLEDKTLTCQHLIVATGGGNMKPKELTLTNALKYKNKQIFYKVENKALFKNKEIIIAGGGASATNWALELSQITPVTMVHRSEVFKTSHEFVTKFKNANNNSLYPSFAIKELIEEGNSLNSIVIESTDAKQLITLKCDYLLVFYGLLPEHCDFVETLQIETNENGKILTSILDNETSVKNIYAIGDVATNTISKIKKNILSAFYEGMQTAYSIFIKKRKRIS